MSGNIINVLISNTFMVYSCEIMLYFFICKVFRLKVAKKKAYLLAFIFALYLPFTDTLLGILVGARIIPLTVPLIIVIKMNSFLTEIILILFLYLTLEIPWYRCYWITIVLHVVLMLPYAVTYSTYFIVSDTVKGTLYLPVNYSNIILYLFFLIINLIWGYAIIKLSGLKKPIRWLDYISKLSWGILYLFWGFILLNTDKYLSSEEYKKVLDINNNNEILSYFTTANLVIIYGAATALIIIISLNIAERRHLKIENNLLKEMVENQYANYLSMQQQDMEIHKLYHDIGNHIETIRVLVSNGENTGASQYTENLAQQYRNIRKHYYCSNSIINAVLLQKLKVCEQNNIEYEVDIKIPEELPLKDIDLMSVFSNLMDNAIESCLRNAESKNCIKIKTAVIGKYLNIKITNTKSIAKLVKSGANNFVTWKADKKMHGYGLKILEEIIRRYDGHKELKDQGSIFSAVVMLKIPEDLEKDQKSKLLA